MKGNMQTIESRPQLAIRLEELTKLEAAEQQKLTEVLARLKGSALDPAETDRLVKEHDVLQTKLSGISLKIKVIAESDELQFERRATIEAECAAGVATDAAWAPKVTAAKQRVAEIELELKRAVIEFDHVQTEAQNAHGTGAYRAQMRLRKHQEQFPHVYGLISQES